MDISQEAALPPVFARAIEQLRVATTRPELALREIPAPGRIAPYAYALSADIGDVPHGRDSDHGTGRFILMHDPEAPEAWDGEFRIVSFTQAPQDTEIAGDPFVLDVAWSWLVEALERRDAEYHAASGTATKVMSKGYGELAANPEGAQIELRASWSPDGAGFAAHLGAWCDLMCALAGFPLDMGATSLDQHRHARETRRLS